MEKISETILTTAWVLNYVLYNRFSRLRLQVSLNLMSTQPGKIMQKRKYPRMEIADIQADVSDGKGFFTGAVKNLSRYGLAIAEVPVGLEKSADIHSVILDGPGAHFKLLIRPVWEEDDGTTKTIGARIENSSWTWTDFVMRQEAEPEELSPI